MKIDLEQAMSDLARSVHDDDVTERMTGQVRTMVGRIRRRRAARHTATGVVSLGAVAGLTVGATQLLDRAAPPVGAATGGPQEPAPDSSSVGLGLECGDRVTADSLRPEWEGFRLELEVDGPAPAGGAVPVVVRLVNDGDTPLAWDTDQVVQLAAMRDGEIVATGTVPASRGVYAPGDTWQTDRSASLRACDGGGSFGAGDYEVVASVIFANAGGSNQVGLSAGPAALTVTTAERPTDTPTQADTPEHSETLDAIIAESDRISADHPFGVCGTRLPEDLDDLPLTVDLVPLSAPRFPIGDTIVIGNNEPLRSRIRVTAREGVVLGNVPTSGGEIVLTHDGVVVARSSYDPGEVDIDETDTIAVEMVEFDTSPTALPASGTARLCLPPGVEAPDDRLPPGTYQLYAVLDVTLKEIQYPDGTGESRSDLLRVPSQPVDVVIE